MTNKRGVKSLKRSRQCLRTTKQKHSFRHSEVNRCGPEIYGLQIKVIEDANYIRVLVLLLTYAVGDIKKELLLQKRSEKSFDNVFQYV